MPRSCTATVALLGLAALLCGAAGCRVKTPVTVKVQHSDDDRDTVTFDDLAVPCTLGPKAPNMSPFQRRLEKFRQVLEHQATEEGFSALVFEVDEGMLFHAPGYAMLAAAKAGFTPDQEALLKGQLAFRVPGVGAVDRYFKSGVDDLQLPFVSNKIKPAATSAKVARPIRIELTMARGGSAPTIKISGRPVPDHDTLASHLMDQKAPAQEQRVVIVAALNVPWADVSKACAAVGAAGYKKLILAIPAE